MSAVALAPPLRSAPAAARATCVVVAYHRPGPLRRLLVGLRHPHLEIVVVNVEDDPAVARAARGCHVVPLAGNPGYAAAVNVGVAEAATSVVVFMNDDVVMAADAVLRLAHLVGRGGVDVAVPQVVDDDGRPVATISAVPSLRALAREWLLLPDRPVRALAGRLRVEKWRHPVRPEPIEAAAAVVVAAPRSLLVDVPLPDPYFLYWEEGEWFWALARRGARVEYRTDVHCRHAGGREVITASKSRLMARNAVRCVRRTQGRLAALGALVVGLAWNLRLAGLDTLRLLGHPTRGWRARAAARWAGVGAAVVAVRELA